MMFVYPRNLLLIEVGIQSWDKDVLDRIAFNLVTPATVSVQSRIPQR